MRENDYRRQLVNYFKRNLSKGYTPDALKLVLINQGYSRTAVEKALEQAHKELSEEAPKFEEKPRIKVTLATGIPAERCQRTNLGYRNPEEINLKEWENKEDEGILLVPRAGEILYRLKTSEG